MSLVLHRPTEVYAMYHGSSSKEVARRLRSGMSSDARRAAEHYGLESAYVQNVRLLIKRLPSSGSQHIRVANQDENWLVSQYRWQREQLAAGSDRAAIRDVLQACLDEFDAETARVSEPAVSYDTLVDLAKAEHTTGAHEDSATVEAVHHKTPGSLRAMIDAGVRQISDLRRKLHVARVLSSSR